VIFIDDLDRCLPDTSIAILESIKNYLTVNHRCIFVLGLNARILYHAVEHKYGGSPIVDGREYLEKILNYTFYVPEPKPNSIKDFVVGWINDLVPDESSREKYKSWFHTLARTLEACRFNNPRKIKRILNRFLLYVAKPKVGYKLEDYPEENVAKLIVMAEYFPSLFQLFLADAKTANSIVEELSFLGTEDFALERFEKTHGVMITSLLPRLILMKQLFKLEPNDTAKPQLNEQAQEVYSITRFI
jgi:hypothetical protein